MIIVKLVLRKKYLRYQNTTIGQPIHDRHITSGTMSDGWTTALRRFLFGIGSVFLPGQQPNLMMMGNRHRNKKKKIHLCVIGVETTLATRVYKSVQMGFNRFSLCKKFYMLCHWMRRETICQDAEKLTTDLNYFSKKLVTIISIKILRASLSTYSAQSARPPRFVKGRYPETLTHYAQWNRPVLLINQK